MDALSIPQTPKRPRSPSPFEIPSSSGPTPSSPSVPQQKHRKLLLAPLQKLPPLPPADSSPAAVSTQGGLSSEVDISAEAIAEEPSSEEGSDDEDIESDGWAEILQLIATHPTTQEEEIDMIDSAHSIGRFAATFNKADVKLACELLDGEVAVDVDRKIFRERVIATLSHQIWEFGGDERCGREVQTYVRDSWVYRACEEFW
ncbi:hypothetical protein BDY24DRAFT_372225 [Mrakia frigida]|uniref:uncharacterized protein n=1 Tax=Mrakia frigida TaxID=29902 RepID=UPI003FCC0147